MLQPIDFYFLQQHEPIKSCLLFLRAFILQQHPIITEQWKYGMPFYCAGNKMICYLWVHKKYNQPYIGFADGNKLSHPDLIQENRARMRILLVDANKDIPVKKIGLILQSAIGLYLPSSSPTSQK